MHCNRCRSVMGATRREETPRSLLEWYDCPVCGLRELVATPTRRPPWHRSGPSTRRRRGPPPPARARRQAERPPARPGNDLDAHPPAYLVTRPLGSRARRARRRARPGPAHPSGAVDADTIVQNVYFVNHAYAVRNLSQARDGARSATC